MIDEYWTWIFYGYHSDELKEFSGKPIVARCDECCKYRVLPKSYYSDICKSCSRSHRRGSEAPSWKGGKPMVECSICGNIFETSRQQGEQSCSHVCSPECNSVLISARMTEQHKNPAFRENLSNRMEEFYSDPINHEKHSAALQGISYDEWEMFATNQGYCPAFDEFCRESNREKYDRRCFLCGLDESENISSTDKHKKLSVHHVDMNKDQGCNGHSWKLVPLCMWCHSKAHGKLVMNRIIYLLNNVWNTV